MRGRSIASVIVFAAAIAVAQNSVPAARDPVRLLQAPSIRERVWGAYLAAQDPRLTDTLVNELRRSTALKEAVEDTEDWIYVEALLDALIQLRAPVPADVLRPFSDGWRDTVYILLTLGNPAEDLLMELRDTNQNLAQWVTVNNLLLRDGSRRLLEQTAGELRPTHVFEVRDVPWPVLRCGGGVGIGVRNRRFPAGYPPIALYQLDVEQLSPLPDTELLLSGPMAARYRRVVVPRDGSVSWLDLNFFDFRSGYREHVIAQAARLDVEEVEHTLHSVTEISWTSPDRFAFDVQDALNQQCDAIRLLLVRAGLASLKSLQLQIDPRIEDLRQGTKVALPVVRPKPLA